MDAIAWGDEFAALRYLDGDGDDGISDRGNRGFHVGALFDGLLAVHSDS